MLIICFNSKRVERNKPAAKWPAMTSITEAVFTFDSHPTNGDWKRDLVPAIWKTQLTFPTAFVVSFI